MAPSPQSGPDMPIGRPAALKTVFVADSTGTHSLVCTFTTSDVLGQHLSEGTLPQSNARRAQLATDLTTKDLVQVNQIAHRGGVSEVLRTARLLQDAVTVARAGLLSFPSQTMASRIGALLASGLGVLTSPMHQAQQHLSEKVKALHNYSNVSLKPILDAIQRRFHGGTFERTEDTPRALVLAAVPTALKHLDHSFEALKERVDALGQDSKGGVKVVRGLGESRVVMSRRDGNGNLQTLEFAFRREGKVNVFFNGRELGGMWNGVAQKLAQEFAAGRSPKLKKVTYSEYTVQKPEASRSAGGSLEAGARGGVKCSSDPIIQSFSDVRRTVALLATTDRQRFRGITYQSGWDDKTLVVSRVDKHGIPQVVHMVQQANGWVAVLLDGKRLGIVEPQNALRFAIGFIKGRPIQGRETVPA